MSEYAMGQFEITLRHRDDALRAVDEAVMFKRKRWGGAEARVHRLFHGRRLRARAADTLHVSLNDAQGKNLFASDNPAGTEPAPGHRRHEGQHGGIDGGVRAQREFLSPLRQ
jgi:glutamine synthetase